LCELKAPSRSPSGFRSPPREGKGRGRQGKEGVHVKGKGGEREWGGRECEGGKVMQF